VLCVLLAGLVFGGMCEVPRADGSRLWWRWFPSVQRAHEVVVTAVFPPCAAQLSSWRLCIVGMSAYVHGALCVLCL
jgi:hypothetical protein